MVDEEKGTQEPNPEEEEETSQTSDSGEEETPKNQEPSLEELQRQLKEYKARMEHHKKKQRELEVKIQELSKNTPKESKKGSEELSVLDLAKKVSALKDYAPDEIDFLEVIAKGKGIDPVEALNTDEFKLFLQAKRQKVAEESKVPQPSTKQAPSQKTYQDYTPEDVEKLPLDERLKYFQWRKNQPPGSLKW